MEEQAATLRAEGQTYHEIANALGVSTTTVYSWLNPEYAERQRRSSREAKRRRQIARCRDCGSPLAYDRQENDRCGECQVEHDFGDRRDRILAAYNRGERAEEIAAREGMTATAVSSCVVDWRARGRHVALRIRPDRDKWPEIERLWRDGKTQREIGREVGLSADLVGSRIQAMRRAGIDLPFRRPR
jgi:DNA-binding CsgD family transcriptional regulator